jgi:glycosyltransferase involved in cell wall biosynthesis
MLLPETPAAAGSGGQVRIYHFVKAAAQVAQVTVAILADRDSGEVAPELNVHRIIRPLESTPPTNQKAGLLVAVKILLNGFRNYGRALMLAGQNICVERSTGQHQSLLHKIYGRILFLQASSLVLIVWLFPNDIHVRGNCWDAVKSQIDELPDSLDYIWCEHSYLFPLASVLRKKFPKARIIVNAHNVEWVLKDSIARTKQAGLSRKWTLLESRLIQRWETRMVEDCSLIYTCSEEDTQRLQQFASDSSAHIVAIPNGVDVNYFVPADGQSEMPTLLFAGTAGYSPNDDAVTWLTSEIFPAVRQRLVNSQLILAGRNAARVWGHLRRPELGVEVLSDVPDMRPLLSLAWVCVVPLRSGSGTRLKIVEAMSSGRCVVSTAIGAEGLKLLPGRDLIVENDASDFVEEVCAVIKDAKRRKAFEQQGRRLACEKFSWQQLSQQAVEAFLSQIESEGLISVD